jgi:hypothetical protein
LFGEIRNYLNVEQRWEQITQASGTAHYMVQELVSTPRDRSGPRHLAWKYFPVVEPLSATGWRGEQGLNGVRASANMWRNPMTSVPADGEANLSAGRPIVKKNMSVPHTTAMLKMPTRDTGHIQ